MSRAIDPAVSTAGGWTPRGAATGATAGWDLPIARSFMTAEAARTWSPDRESTSRRLTFEGNNPSRRRSGEADLTATLRLDRRSGHGVSPAGRLMDVQSRCGEAVVAPYRRQGPILADRPATGMARGIGIELPDSRFSPYPVVAASRPWRPRRTGDDRAEDGLAGPLAVGDEKHASPFAVCADRWNATPAAKWDAAGMAWGKRSVRREAETRKTSRSR